MRANGLGRIYVGLLGSLLARFNWSTRTPLDINVRYRLIVLRFPCVEMHDLFMLHVAVPMTRFTDAILQRDDTS